MGYESRLYVVRKSDWITEVYDDGKYWGEVLARFDIGKTYEISNMINTRYPKTNCYIYEENGNDRILEDNYGSPLTEIPLDDMINIINNHRNNDYRWKPVLSYLISIQSDVKNWGDRDIVVLHYGY